MNRLKTAAVAVAVGVTTSCAPSAPEAPPQSTRQSESQESVVQGRFSDEALVTIDTGETRQAYPRLPAGVQRAAGAAVSLDVLVDPGQVITAPNGDPAAITGRRTGLGSGAVIESGGRRYILSAAHVTGDVAEHCADTMIFYQEGLVGGNRRATRVRQQSPASPNPEAWDEGFNGGRDAVLLVPDETPGNVPLASLPAIPIERQSPTVQPGEVIFTANYQPTADTQRRDSSSLGGPAIYSMVALREDQGYLYVLTNSGRSYGQVPDTDIRGGASGGQAVTEEGKFIGDIAASYSEDGSYPEKLIEHDYNVDIVDRPGAAYNVGFIKLIDQNDISDMANTLGPECTQLQPR